MLNTDTKDNVITPPFLQAQSAEVCLSTDTKHNFVNQAARGNLSTDTQDKVKTPSFSQTQWAGIRFAETTAVLLVLPGDISGSRK